MRGAPTRGVPTGVLTPLYRTAPTAATRDPHVHEVLALIDALRELRARLEARSLDGARA